MNSYDFDKTIYRGDSTTDFFFYFILTRPYMLFFTPWFLLVGLMYVIHIIDKKKFKEMLFFFVPWCVDIEKIVDKFWEHNANKIEDWFCECKEEDDVIVSASLSFILKPVMQILDVKNLIATEFNIKTGKIIGENCYGEQKVIAFKKIFKNKKPQVYVSDSLSDLPMMKLAGKGYLVKNGKLTQVNLQNN